MTATASRFPAFNPHAFAAPGEDPRQDPRLSRTLRIIIDIPEVFAPALKSAIEDISNQVGGRLEEGHKYDYEDAQTRAAVALGIARSAVTKLVPAGDPFYSNR